MSFHQQARTSDLLISHWAAWRLCASAAGPGISTLAHIREPYAQGASVSHPTAAHTKTLLVTRYRLVVTAANGVIAHDRVTARMCTNNCIDQTTVGMTLTRHFLHVRSDSVTSYLAR
jgi:hypothetical protein